MASALAISRPASLLFSVVSLRSVERIRMAEELVQLKAGERVSNWIIEKKLGEGAFGAVYKCSDSKGNLFALKVEGANEQIQLLKMEVLVLMELDKSGGRHFCKIEDRGRISNFNYVVMTMVGESLMDLRNRASNKRFTYGTAASVAIQCLEALEDLHGIGYLHRDVKPGNYTIGRKELNELRKVYVLDFGMCRKFIHEDGTIRTPRQVAGFRGTVKYAPISCHRQRELCRLDDLETWLYMIIEFTKGSLPWRNLKNADDVGKMKKDCRTDNYRKMMFGGCPREYMDVLRVIDSGGFFDEPKYGEIYELLRQAIRNVGVSEFPYDWENWAKEEEARKAAEQSKKEKDANTDEKPAEKEEKDVQKENKKENGKEDKKEENNNDKNQPKDDKPDGKSMASKKTKKSKSPAK